MRLNRLHVHCSVMEPRFGTLLCVSSQLNVCSVCSLLVYGRTTGSAAIWVLFWRLISGHTGAQRFGPISVGQHLRRRHVETWVSKTNEWSLLKRRFDELVHDESVGNDSIEKIFDAEFYRRFAELINRVADRQSRTGTPVGPRLKRRSLCDERMNTGS